MPQYKVRNETTGKIVTFDWTGDTPPTDTDMEEIFAEAGKMTPAPAPETQPQAREVARKGFPWGATLKTGVQRGVGEYLKTGERVAKQILPTIGAPLAAAVLGPMAGPLVGASLLAPAVEPLRKTAEALKLGGVATALGKVGEVSGKVTEPIKKAFVAPKEAFAVSPEDEAEIARSVPATLGSEFITLVTQLPTFHAAGEGGAQAAEKIISGMAKRYGPQAMTKLHPFLLKAITQTFGTKVVPGILRSITGYQVGFGGLAAAEGVEERGLVGAVEEFVKSAPANIAFGLGGTIGQLVGKVVKAPYLGKLVGGGFGFGGAHVAGARDFSKAGLTKGGLEALKGVALGLATTKPNFRKAVTEGRFEDAAKIAKEEIKSETVTGIMFDQPREVFKKYVDQNYTKAEAFKQIVQYDAYHKAEVKGKQFETITQDIAATHKIPRKEFRQKTRLAIKDTETDKIYVGEADEIVHARILERLEKAGELRKVGELDAGFLLPNGKFLRRWHGVRRGPFEVEPIGLPDFAGELGPGDIHKNIVGEALKKGKEPYEGWEKDYPDLVGIKESTLQEQFLNRRGLTPDLVKQLPVEDRAQLVKEYKDFLESKTKAKEPVPKPPVSPPGEKPVVGKTPAPPKGTVAKEPWEMTAREFGDYVRKGGHKETIVPNIELRPAVEYGGKVYSKKGIATHAEALLLMPEELRKETMKTPEAIKSGWVDNKGNFVPGDAVDQKFAHKHIINQALSEGKPVPLEVLKDYPDLAGKGVIEAPKEIDFLKLANELQVPAEQHRTILKALRYDPIEEAWGKLNRAGIEVTFEQLEKLKPFAQGSPGVRGEYRNSVSEGMEEVLGANADRLFQDLSDVMNVETSRIKTQLKEKYEQWQTSNRREGDSEIWSFLDAMGLKGLKDYVAKVKPGGKPTELVMHHGETKGLLENVDPLTLKRVYQVMGKDAWTILVSGQKLFEDASVWSKAALDFLARAEAELNPQMKETLKRAGAACMNNGMDKFVKYRLAQTDAGRFIEYSKQNKKANAFNLLNKLNNYLQSAPQEILTPDNITDVFRKLQAGETFEQAVKPTVMDKINEWQKAIKLTSPVTHIKNTASNIANIVYQSNIEKAFAATADLFRGQRTTYFGEIKQGWRGLKLGIVKGLPAALEALRVDKPGARAYETTWMKQPAIGGKFGKLVRLPFRALEASDAFFREVARYTILEQELYAKHVKTLRGTMLQNKIAEDIASPPKDLGLFAENKAEEWLYREKMGQTGQQMQKMLAKTPILQTIVPFFRTPANVWKWMWRRTPILGLAGRNMADLKAGGRVANEAIARQVTGVLTGMGVYALYKSGLIVLGVPEREDERQQFYREGKVPWSIKAGNRYYQVGQIEPFSSLFKVLGVTVKGIDEYTKALESGAEDPGKLATGVFKNWMDALLDQTFVIGLSDLANVTQDPVRYLGTFFKNYLTGMTIPSGVGYMARAFDPTIRQAQGPLQAAMAKIPGLSQKLPPRLGPLGEEQERVGLVGRLQPLVVSGPKLGDVRFVDKELQRLGLTIPYILASRKVTMPGPEKKKVKLTPTEYNSILTEFGPHIERKVMATVLSKNYRERTDEEKKKLLADQIAGLVRHYSEMARRQTIEAKR